MDAKTTAPTHDEKMATTYDDKNDMKSDKQAVDLENVDYTGAEKKTDPVEIALVRKIDWRLMVCNHSPILHTFSV